MILKRIDDALASLYGRICQHIPLAVRCFMPGWTLISFGLSSCCCLVIDKAVFTMVCLPLQNVTGRASAIAIGLVVARMVSGNCNYIYNQSVVFRHAPMLKSYLQYWGLVVINVLLSMLATQVIVEALDVRGLVITLMNFCVDVALFVFSFTIQKLVIFKRRDVK